MPAAICPRHPAFVRGPPSRDRVRGKILSARLRPSEVLRWAASLEGSFLAGGVPGFQASPRNAGKMPAGPTGKMPVLRSWMSLALTDYDYDLPEELIASRPLSNRQDSRMMVLHRREQRIEHRTFAEAGRICGPGDLLVLNNTRVVNARRFSDDGKIEFLFLEQLGPKRWKCLVRPGRKMRDRRAGSDRRCRADAWKKFARMASGSFRWSATSIPVMVGWSRCRLIFDGRAMLRISSVTRRSTRKCRGGGRADGRTAFHPGDARCAAAHFHHAACRRRNISAGEGGKYFRAPHARESFTISEPAAAAINAAERIVAVGTTTVRVLESATRDDDGLLFAQEGATDIFIHPPAEIRQVDALLTNFHLPRSTLLMLVSAFAGREFLLARLRGSDPRTLSFLQLRRLHVDPVKEPARPRAGCMSWQRFPRSGLRGRPSSGLC